MTFIAPFIKKTNLCFYYDNHPWFDVIKEKYKNHFKIMNVLTLINRERPYYQDTFCQVFMPVNNLDYFDSTCMLHGVVAYELDTTSQNGYKRLHYEYDLPNICTPDIFLNISLSQNIRLSRIIKSIKIYPKLTEFIGFGHDCDSLQSTFTGLYLEQLINVKSNYSNLLLPLISILNYTLLPIGRKDRNHYRQVADRTYIGIHLELQENIPVDLKYSITIIFSSNFKRYHDLISSKCLTYKKGYYNIQKVTYLQPVCKHNYFKEKCDCEYQTTCMNNAVRHLIKQLYVCFEDNDTPDYFKLTVYNIKFLDFFCQLTLSYIRFYEKYKGKELKDQYTFIIKTDKNKKLQELINHDDFLDFLLTNCSIKKNIKIMDSKKDTNIKYHLFEEKINGVDLDLHYGTCHPYLYGFD